MLHALFLPDQNLEDFSFAIVTSMPKQRNIAGEQEECLDENAPSPEFKFDLNFSYNEWNNNPGISTHKRIRTSENGNSSADVLSENKPQDADYSLVSSLSDELESLIFAKFPRSEHWKLCFVHKRSLALLKTGELYKIRREINFQEPSIFMFASGESTWCAFDQKFNSRIKLPILPSDPCFSAGDKESICAGTNLLVSGREIDGLVIYRYELAMNKWLKGPSMISPRCLFASATCGTFAYVAGGMGATVRNEVFNSAEKYNPDSQIWEPLPRMKRKRKLCAGIYMDDKFYVIGGRNEDGELTCGEYLDEARNIWVLIPDMLKDDPVQTSHSPPLLAVVKNELYSIESSTNKLKVYLKKSNTWKALGVVPVRADCNRGWGVAFKSLGDKLLVIGAAAGLSAGNCMAIYTYCPGDDESGELQWRRIDSGRNRLSHFILNCSVMVA
ncbi:hypothetical protein ACJIZ3_015160 [Penstemon smallii]|uniref:Uncharacterized protein n=1 Tax=Penstemon smallii TaxID=265156 RepID=A0ABD3RNZ8_9LAMI